MVDKFDSISLKALRIFSVAAKYENFSKAAENLHITPSAVSHQIKRLEAALCCKLFNKENGHLELTHDAEIFATRIQKAFSSMREATEEFTQQDTKKIHLGIETALALNCITPALGVWLEENTDLDISLRMVSCYDDLINSGLDVLLTKRIDDNFYDSTFVIDEIYYPVCSKNFYNSLDLNKYPDFYLRGKFIDLEDVNCWSDWCAAKEVEMPEGARTIYFSHTVLALQAALADQGIALLERKIIQNDVNSGNLVILDHDGLNPEGAAYYISNHKKHRNNQNVNKLKSWITNLIIE